MCRSIVIFGLVIALGASLANAQLPVTRWYKGNTHTHTLRSDGDSEPADVVKWYRDHGYNFLFITDHETVTPVEPLNSEFGKNGEFIIFAGQEVTDRLNGKPYHVNGLGVSSVTMPQRGTTIVDNLQLNIDGVRRAGGIAQINHPNFGWALNADSVAQVKNATLIEIFNAHPLVNNLGGGGVPSVEELWDQVLTSGVTIFGVASDDSHIFKRSGDRSQATPGHAWIMVRSPVLTRSAILNALVRGDFYATTGVELDEVAISRSEISVRIKSTRWSKYRTRFIGTGGKILGESIENPAVYRFRGTEGYVRIKVFESNGQIAWTQPVFLRDLR